MMHKNHKNSIMLGQQRKSIKFLHNHHIPWIYTGFMLFIILINDGFHIVHTQKAVERGQVVPIGAFRIFHKTSFSCLGRPAGYYADIETGCQVYHMCDGLGRQFSYSCPNTTLFQQRMLICDHWYMVNCSKAESDYAANLLIGQRDKPFVPEEENHLRTPRPDLLDRPYAPDYSGESFRNQYKDHRQISNEISDSDGTEKQYFHEVNPPSATRWHLPRPSPEIQPPHTNFVRRNDVVEENIAVDLGTSHSSNYNTSGDFSAEVSSSFVPTQGTTSTPITTTTTAATTPTTTAPTTTKNSIQTSIPYIKPPSRLYEPPFLYPIYNLNYTESENQEEDNYEESSTASTTTTIQTTTPTTLPPSSPPPSTTTTITTFSTTRPSLTQPTIFAGRPFAPAAPTSLAPTAPLTTTTEDYEENPKPQVDDFVSGTQITHSTTQPKAFETQTQTTFRISTSSEQPPVDVSTPFLDLLPPIFNDNVQPAQPEPFKRKSNSNEPIKSKSNSNELPPPTPPRDLLPPFQEIVLHDVATTQGPPIYYEWKIPSDGLEPPKFDPPQGIENDSQPKDDVVSVDSTIIKENYTTSSPFANNPFLAPILNNREDQQIARSSIRTPTVRSIPKTTTQKPLHFSSRKGNIDDEDVDENDTGAIANRRSANVGETARKDVDIRQLQRDYLIPDFLFPLEDDARIGYEQSNIVNSFQLKIPERRNNEKPWYGENPECPECLPSFVKPGTCEPCVRRR